MKQILERIAEVRERIRVAAEACGRDPREITLLAVSKTKPLAALRSAIAAGQRAFGENYLQDALPKIAALADEPLEWHFIGRLQSNKTAEISAHFDWVHGLDSRKHAERLSRQRPKSMGPLNLCLQVNLSGEASKGGVTAAALPELARAVSSLPGLRLRGLMTMPDPTLDADRTRATFDALAACLDSLKRDGLSLDTLSMGMSRDMETAIAAGSTLVRIGTDIFGPRQ
jgi:pyridoxal phosphate enzyme (YggS family)